MKASRIQCDEIWSFCHAKEKNVASAKAAPEGAGDVWTWTAIDADTKLIVSLLRRRSFGRSRQWSLWTIFAPASLTASSSPRTATAPIWRPLKARSAATWTMRSL